jgi:hypothetical protein
MRRLGAVVLSALVFLPLVALNGSGADAFVHAMRATSGHEQRLIVAVAFECGVFDGKFQCRPARGGKQFGKGATPGAPEEPQATAPEAPPPSPDGTQGTQGWTSDTATACQGGMVGTPPNCQCPENSELLGGNCVRYTASACNNALAADAVPQACRGIEEKLSCKLRADGLKDCCCVTYDKF